MTVKPALHGRDHCPDGVDPIPAGCLGTTPAVWAYLGSFAGGTVPQTDWFSVDEWDTCLLSDQAASSGVLFPDPEVDDFAIHLDATTADSTEDGGVWLITVYVAWVGDIPATGYVVIANLSDWPSTSGQDVNNFQPANELFTHSFDQGIAATATRVRKASGTNAFFTLEIGNFTGANQDFGQVEMVVCKVAQNTTQSFF